MEAIVRISGKQYRVAAGERVIVDRLASKIGDKVTFDQVLLLTDGAKATVGMPVVDGAAVTATVLAAPRGPKLIVYKYKAKKRYRRTQGARAEQTLLEVVSVRGPGARARTTSTAAPETAKAPAPETAKAPAPETAKAPAAEAAKAPAPETAKAPAPEAAKGPPQARKAPAPRARKAPAAEADKLAKAEALKPAKAEAAKPAKTKTAKPAGAKKSAAKAKKD
jgi:large subunit ribosomal protein L21